MTIENELKNSPPREIIGRAHENFDPWLTFRGGCQGVLAGALLLIVGAAWQYVTWENVGLLVTTDSEGSIAILPRILLIFGTLLLVIFSLLLFSGFVGALLDIKNDSFLVRYGVPVDGEKVTDPQQQVSPRDGLIIKAGKRRWAKIVIGE